MAGDKPSFSLPQIAENTSGWGPLSPPKQFEDLPYLPFGKGDKLGKAADWTASSQYQSRFPSRHFGGADVQSVFSFSGADDASFTVVDTQKQTTTKHRPRKYGAQYTQRVVRNPQQQYQAQNAARRGGKQNLPRVGKRWKQTMHRYASYRQNFDKRPMEPSISIKSDWTLIQDIDIGTLSKLTHQIEGAETIAEIGNVYYMDESYLGVSTKNEKSLQNNETAFFNKTTSDDLVIRNLVSQGNVFATDSVLSLLMAAPRAAFPWDIVVQKVGSKLFLDKREGSKIDLLTVNETSIEPPTDDKDSFNSATALSKEATLIDQYFARQMLDDSVEPVSLKTDNIPADFSLQNVHRGYRYRKINISESIQLIVRCDIDAAKKGKSGIEYWTINAINEFDPKASGIDWRQKLDAQPGAVFATELKNNSFKIARWASRVVLSGTDGFLLGYVSRASPKDPNNHGILKVQSYKPDEFIQNINGSSENMWAILKALMDIFLKQEDGKYVLLKDPNAPILSLYKVPAASLDE